MIYLDFFINSGFYRRLTSILLVLTEIVTNKVTTTEQTEVKLCWTSKNQYELIQVQV